jgi:cytochrome c553
MRPGRLVIVVGALVVVVGLAAGGWWWHTGRLATPFAIGPAAHVGSPACASCHGDADQRWRQSHHALAMQPATEATVAGDFNGARLT